MNDHARDAELVRRFLAGDAAAFDEIVALHRGGVFLNVLRLLNSRPDAEEVTQDTFIRVHRGLARFRGESSFATWLYQIASNLARNRYWYWCRRKRGATLSLDYAYGDGDDATLADVLPDTATPGPVHDLELREFEALIHATLPRLSAEHRDVLVLRMVRHLSYDQISWRLNIRVGTVKSRLARARLVLMSQLPPEFNGGGQ